MTPAQLDHLRRIDAHLANLLSTAEKRTPGEWGMNQLTQMFLDGKTSSPPMAIQRSYVEDKQTFAEPFRGWCSYADASFIAACAGNAEAGWRATRAAIATALDCESWDAMIKEMYIRQDAEAILESILTAFPNV